MSITCSHPKHKFEGLARFFAQGAQPVGDDLEIGRIKLAAVLALPLNRNFAEVTAAFLEAERIGQLFEWKAAVDNRA